MDLEAARSFLPSYTRARMGVAVSILPMADGKASSVADTSRSIQNGVMGRFDFAPEVETLGGGGAERAHAAKINSPHATISFAVADLQAQPQQMDRIGWQETPQTERLFRIDRVQSPVTGVCLCYLTELK